MVDIAIRFIGPAVSTIRLLLAWMKMPGIEFHQPENTATEEHLVWWHIPVSLKYKLLKPFPLQDLSADLVIEKPIYKTLHLCWRSDQGPQRRVTLFDSETYHIPIAARTTLNSFMLATTSGMVIPPGSLGDWIMNRGTPRIVDVQHYFVFTSVTDLRPPGKYEVTLRLLAGHRLMADKSYLITVPKLDASNGYFTIHPF
jgi:hypothetical protein